MVIRIIAQRGGHGRRWRTHCGGIREGAIVKVAGDGSQGGAVQQRVVSALYTEARVRLQAEDYHGRANEEDGDRGDDLQKGQEEEEKKG